MDSKDRKAHIPLGRTTGGKGMDGWFQSECICGWKGKKHYNYCSYQFSNAREEFDRHAKALGEGE